jgi:hypothetical protein
LQGGLIFEKRDAYGVRQVEHTARHLQLRRIQGRTGRATAPRQQQQLGQLDRGSDLQLRPVRAMKAHRAFHVRVRQAERLHQPPARHPELLERRLQSLVVQECDLHGALGRERLRQELARARLGPALRVVFVPAHIMLDACRRRPPHFAVPGFGGNTGSRSERAQEEAADLSSEWRAQCWCP